YLYRAIDADGLTLDIWLRKKRDTQAAYAFLKRLHKQFGEPKAIVTDKAPSLGSAFRKLQSVGLYTKEKRNDTPISAKKDIMGDKTVRVRADLHHIIKIETAKNGGNVKEVMEIRLRSKLKSVLIVHYLKILYNR
ncbi:DDE-type integrase/transposase/recombinase, partial [Enterococcus faecalis]|uniref:DDE-type integrase/transposase/recombinase n=1 Tax=Enterococcus faecalis TaxID=1351 RepID=UPI0024154245